MKEAANARNLPEQDALGVAFEATRVIRKKLLKEEKTIEQILESFPILKADGMVRNLSKIFFLHLIAHFIGHKKFFLNPPHF